MMKDIDLENVLFLDIETVPRVFEFEELDDDWRDLWAEKMRFISEREGLSPGDLYERAGIYAEFGKIICISTAIFHQVKGETSLRVKSFFGKNEKSLLGDFLEMLNRFDRNKQRLICGHNSKEFDIPYIARRAVVCGLELPEIINLSGKKPWEVQHLDTMQMWKFGDYKHFTSLKLLAKLFDIPTPKEDISGSDVAKVFWETDDLERIKSYCERDTITVARLVQRFNNLEPIHNDYIEVV